MKGDINTESQDFIKKLKMFTKTGVTSCTITIGAGGTNGGAGANSSAGTQSTLVINEKLYMLLLAVVEAMVEVVAVAVVEAQVVPRTVEVVFRELAGVHLEVLLHHQITLN